MDKRELEFWCIDFWSRPIFRDQKGNLFCSLDKLFQYGATFEQVTELVDENDIVYFGRDLDDDPMGTSINPNKIVLVKEFSEEN